MTYRGTIRQQYSHFTLDADIYLADVKAPSGKHWYSRKQLKKLPMSMAEKKILALLDSHSERSEAKPKNLRLRSG
jgi:hypothetical protein